MTIKLRSDLASALSELAGGFGDDPETLHLAVAAVFSAIYRASDVDLIIVGGQSAAHWLRAPGSRDTDFACTDYQAVREDLLAIGFAPADIRFRLLHPTSHVLIELFETPIQAAGIEVGLDGVTVMRRTDVADARVRGLMPGDAPVVDPATAFLNYADASRPSSGWHDANDGGTKARDRADALLALYPTNIADALATQASKGALPAHVQQFLLDAFGLELSCDGLSRD